MKTTIKATPNFSKRTFTIRKYEDDKLIAKYRTTKRNYFEFDSELMNTENDWKQFLRNNADYEVLK